MPGLHGLNVHTIQAAHTRLRPKLHLFSYHPYGALQRNFKLGIEGENLVLAKIWWETVTSGNGHDRNKGKVCSPASAGTESARARSGKGS